MKKVFVICLCAILSLIAVGFICKSNDSKVLQNSEYLRIHIHDALDGAYYDISLPCFKKNTMYKNMELGKRYTLEELGLWLT